MAHRDNAVIVGGGDVGFNLGEEGDKVGCAGYDGVSDVGDVVADVEDDIFPRCCLGDWSEVWKGAGGGECCKGEERDSREMHFDFEKWMVWLKNTIDGLSGP